VHSLRKEDKKRFQKELTRMGNGLLGFKWEKRGNEMPKTKKPKTHFEQVPLEIVKKIVKEEIPDNSAIEVDVTPELPVKK
jgi:hypothetical protein